jgi:acyl-CoA thioester hydrolase
MLPTTLTPAKADKYPDGGPAAETTFHVRYAETDQMGIVHHGVYPIWLEEGRSTWSRQAGRPYADFEASGYALAVSEMTIRYLAPARYDQRVTVRTRLSQVRSRQVRFDYEVLDSRTGTCLATAYTIHICVDKLARTTRIPPDWYQFWSVLASSG